MDKKYYAFISYKREDLKQAEWLRNKLSHYRFPSKLRKENEALPKAIRPLFRDSLELAGGFLAKEIETALSESKYLIVICSPRSAKSPWVNKEVEYFIEHGCEEYIIPYVIDGEPFSNDPEKECFPPALKSLQGEKELLGISTSELSKEAAAVKVVARMFGLRFDTLWQGYNREQKKRRIAWGAAALFVLLLSVSVSALLYKNKNEISRQKQQIESQNKELIRKQDNLLINQSKYLASEAKKEYDKGNITKALRMALYALPKDLKNMDRPYVAEAEQMLRECTSPKGDSIYCHAILRHNDYVNSFSFTSDGKYIITSCGNSVYIWDAYSCRKISTYEHKNEVCAATASIDGRSIYTISFTNNNISKNAPDFSSNKPDTIFIKVWDTAKHKIIKTTAIPQSPIHSPFFELSIGADGKTLAYYTGSECSFYNLSEENGEIGKVMFKRNSDSEVSFSHDGKRFVTTSSDTVRIWDATSGKLISELIHGSKVINTTLDSRNGSLLAVTSNPSTLHRWTSSNNKVTTSIDEFCSFPTKISNLGKYIVIPHFMSVGYKRIIDVEQKKPIGEMCCTSLRVELSPDDGILLATNDYDVYVHRINVEGDRFQRMHKQIGPADFVSYSNNGKYLLVISDKNKLVLDPETLHPIDSLDAEETELLLKAALHEDSIKNNNSDYICNTNYNDAVKYIIDNRKSTGTVELSTDGKYLLLALSHPAKKTGEHNLEVYDAGSGRLVFCNDYFMGLRSASFSPDTRHILIGIKYGLYGFFTRYAIMEFPPLQELIDKYRKDPELDWSLSEEEKAEYNLE